MTDKVKVLFVCIHNAARSRMAEALLRRLGGAQFEVASAGFEPTEVNPLVVEALAQIGLSLPSTGRQPSVFERYRAGHHFHYVIAVCDEESGERCPLFPGATQRLQWSFPDPNTFPGTHAEQLSRIVEIRSAIETRIKAWLYSLSDPPAKART